MLIGKVADLSKRCEEEMRTERHVDCITSEMVALSGCEIAVEELGAPEWYTDIEHGAWNWHESWFESFREEAQVDVAREHIDLVPCPYSEGMMVSRGVQVAQIWDEAVAACKTAWFGQPTSSHGESGVSNNLHAPDELSYGESLYDLEDIRR